MKLLAVDTSTKHLSIAVTEGDKVLVSRNPRPRKDLSMTITFDIEKTLQKANVFLHDLDGFVVGLGPGSFTSLRVGLSMMKAFIMVTEKPVVGIPSLDAIAMNVRSRKAVNVCVISDARRGLMYTSVYEKKNSGLVRKCDHMLLPIEEVLEHVEGETLFIGDGVPLGRDVIVAESKSSGRFQPIFEPEKHWRPRASELARLGYQRLLRGDKDRVETLVPLYLYPADCQVHRSPAASKTKVGR